MRRAGWLAMFAPLLLGGCGAGGGERPILVQLVHLASDAGPFRVTYMDQSIDTLTPAGQSALAFGEASRTMAVNGERSTRFAGFGPDGRRYFRTSFVGQSGQRYLIALLGRLAPVADEPGLTALVQPVQNNLPTTVPALRCLHAAVGVGPVTIIAEPVLAEGAAEGPEPTTVATGLAYGQASGVSDGVSAPVTVNQPEIRLLVRSTADDSLLLASVVTLVAGEVSHFAVTGAGSALALLRW